MNNGKDKKFNKKKLIAPVSVCIAALVLCMICAPLTTSVNAGVAIGILVLMVGTAFLLFTVYNEVYRIGIETPFPLKFLFPNFPIVEDKDETDRSLSGFRAAVNEYLSCYGNTQNSSLQNYSSQLQWHSFYLWKKRMDNYGLTLLLDSNRRAYTSKKNSVRREEYFDGRYRIKDVYEEIDATRTFLYNGRKIKTLADKEVAHYTILSAMEATDGRVMCPSCGNYTTRENLIDGCDYCGTKFTVEDMSNSISSFGFRHDFSVNESKREAVRDLVYPWVFLITEMPFVYFGFFGAFLYMDENVFARLLTGIVAAGLFGLFAWFLVKVNMAVILPIVIGLNYSKEKANRKLVYRSEEAKEQERGMAEYVRQFDGKFSIQSFFGGIQNKLTAVHFSDNKDEINAFSDVDLSEYLDEYRNIVDMDIMSITLERYEMLEGNINMPDGVQNAVISADILLRYFVNGSIVERNEQVEMRLSKNGRCRTQAVCAPSLMKCKKCGASISLLEGKKCAYCGNELDYQKYDWAITGYNSFL